MNEFTMNSNIDIDTFLKELRGRTYRFTYMERLNHWGENAFFLQERTKNNYELYYHKAYIRDFFRMKLSIISTADGIQVTAKQSRNILTSWNLGSKSIDLIVNLLNEICSMGNIK